MSVAPSPCEQVCWRGPGGQTKLPLNCFFAIADGNDLFPFQSQEEQVEHLFPRLIGPVNTPLGELPLELSEITTALLDAVSELSGKKLDSALVESWSNHEERTR